MPIAEHGGFDIVAEIPESTALAAAATISLGSPAARDFAANGPTGSPAVKGTISTVTTVKAVTFLSTGRLAIDLDIAGTRIDVLEQYLFPLLPKNVATWMQRIDAKGSIRVSAPLVMTPAHALVINLTPGPSAAMAELTLDEAPILANPLVQFVLAQAILADPTNGAAYQLMKALLLAEFTKAFNAEVTKALTQLGTVTLAAAPTLPATPSGTPLLITRSAFVTFPQSLKLCYQTNGVGGSTAAITASSLVRRTAGGAPVDAMAIGLSNAFVLRDLVRDGLAVGLMIPVGAFVTTHPLMLFTPITLPIPTVLLPPGIIRVICNSIIGGIDGTNVRLQVSFTAVGAGDAFTMTATVDAAFSVTAGPGSPPSLAVATVPGAVVSSDLAIAWWVYAGIAFTGALPLLHIISTADIFTTVFLGALLGPVIDRLAAPLAATFTAPVTSGLPAMTVRAPISLGQPNAITRFPIVPFPGVGTLLPFPDPFGDNDIVITLV